MANIQPTTEAKTIQQLFPGLDESLYEEMMQYGEIRHFKAGDTILRKGQMIRSAMLVMEGLVKLYQEDEEGDEFFMYHLEPGQACALSMVCTFGQEKSKALARAMTDVTVLSIPLQYMEKWLVQYKSWHHFVIRTYRSRYEELLKTINEIAFKNMDERLEFYILKQVKQFGRHIRLTHQEIATDLNSSREVISRLLKKMEKNGWVVIHRNSFEWVRQ